MVTLDMIRIKNRDRSYHWFGPAKYKLSLSLRVDRAAAAELLREARAHRRRVGYKPSWRGALELAAAWAKEEAGEDDTALIVFDHIEYIMERLVRQ